MNSQTDLRITCVGPAAVGLLHPLGVQAAHEVDVHGFPDKVAGGTENITSIEFVIDDHSLQLPQLQNINLNACNELRSLKYTIIWSTPDNLRQTTVIAVWRGILEIIKTVHQSVTLSWLVVENPLPRSLLRDGWSRSGTIEALREPLYLVDKRMVGLVDRGSMQHVTITPQRGDHWSLQTQPFLDSEEIRFRNLFQALSDYGMLAFSARAIQR